ncbi:hypothetical protein [Nocardia amamiensis]|uniref:hypothetical protein n=1 Tax=Nocardia amamiensis TaxID=404578 RepID=UPI00083511B0|nr:hypothetical protein [Nocardia amamiensis]
MTSAHDYEELHHLVDRLTPAQARHLRLLVSEDPELSTAAAAADETDDDGVPDALLSLAGIWESGRTDTAERHDEYIRERLRRRRSEWE